MRRVPKERRNSMKIHYITSHGAAERIDFNDGDGDTLTLCFEPHLKGAVILGDKVLPLKGGEAEIRLNTLKDGEYLPRLETESGIYRAEGFTKRGAGITVPRANETAVRRLILRCYTLEKELHLLKERTEELERLCAGHHIFDFERKKK